MDFSASLFATHIHAVSSINSTSNLIIVKSMSAVFYAGFAKQVPEQNHTTKNKHSLRLS